jgi:hypothetical protein
MSRSRRDRDVAGRTPSQSNDRIEPTSPTSSMTSRGAFIVIEGLDRSGKSTQAARLLARLEAASKPAQLIKFPGKRRSLPVLQALILEHVSAMRLR